MLFSFIGTIEMDSDSGVSAVLPALGIDIARRKLDVAVRVNSGRGAFKFKSFANDTAVLAALATKATGGRTFKASGSRQY
jgi:hypothetical protein